MHLLDRLNAVFKHRRVAATAFVLVVTAMMVQTYSTVPIYPGLLAGLDPGRAHSAGRESERQRSGVLAGRRAVLPDAVQILQSRGLARRVVRTLELQHNPLFNGDGAAVRAIRSRWSARRAPRRAPGCAA